MQTPLRSLRINNELWEDLQRAAEQDGLTASEIIRALIQGYVQGK